MHASLKEAEQYVADDNSLAAYLQAVHDCTFSFEQRLIWDARYDSATQEYAREIENVARELMRTYWNASQKASSQPLDHPDTVRAG